MSDRLVLGHGEFAVGLLKALNLPIKGVKCITIIVHAAEPVMVTVERYVYEHEAFKVNEIPDRYNLVPKIEELDITSLDSKAREFAAVKAQS